jgi:pilus assembly protein Flp/PilA
MIDSANPSSVTVHPLARAGSKVRRRWLIALLLPALILTASPQPVMATPVNKGTAIEYGLIAALIALAIMVGAGSLGDALNTKFKTISQVVGDSPKSPQNQVQNKVQNKVSTQRRDFR